MDFPQDMSKACFAFRGYDVKNLGRTPELLAVPEYRPFLLAPLAEASQECTVTLGKPVDLIGMIDAGEDFELEHYGEALAMIVAIEQGQLSVLRECHGIDTGRAAFNFGFSLGEISALVAGGTFELADALRIPLALTPDCIELARDVTLGIVFSRREALNIKRIQNMMVEINALDQGVIGMSTHISPNSMLVMGTGNTISVLKERIKAEFSKDTKLRCNDYHWPPLHTPIVWEKDLNSRTGRMLHTIPGAFTKPSPNILSLLTGEMSYDDFNTREHMTRWVDHPQKLWDVVCAVLHSDVQAVIHAGPTPNIFPATFDRLTKNIETQISANRGVKALSTVIERPWLKKLLPKDAGLLRAPKLRHIILEDWLIENAPQS
ncbi:MAG: hypothetical protein P1V20_03865 [Verrucomicrobiales bacterium]|nr:hypothetical protein [Verrucomicrobiales bacterium]